MIYKYYVDCWVNPKSGFDLAEFSKATKKIKKIVGKLFNFHQPEKIIDKFRSGHENMVIERLVIMSDKPYEDNIEEINEKIQKQFPGAEIISYQELKSNQPINSIIKSGI